MQSIGTTSDARPTICVPSSNEGKTQVRWVVVIGWKVRKWTRANNVLLNGYPCHVLDFDEMIMKSPCRETWKNI